MPAVQPEIRMLLTFAAEKRVVGGDWSDVAQSLSVTEAELHRLVQVHAATWRALLQKTVHDLEQKARAEAIGRLRQLLRHPDDGIRMAAAERLLRGTMPRLRRRGKNQPPLDSALANYVLELQELSDADIRERTDFLLERFVAGRSQRGETIEGRPE